MAGRSFTRHSNGVGNRIKAEHINELQVASETDDARIDAKADSSALAAHESDTTNPHNVTAFQVGAYAAGEVDAALAQKAGVADLAAHESDSTNPHNVTNAQVGLGNVDNTSDMSKPVSTAMLNALNLRVPMTRTVNGKPLTSNITLAKSDVGLGNVDNTSDANKPISVAQQAALDTKAEPADITAAVAPVTPGPGEVIVGTAGGPAPTDVRSIGTPPWTPGTAYVTGDIVRSPGRGDEIRATEDHVANANFLADLGRWRATRPPVRESTLLSMAKTAKAGMLGIGQKGAIAIRFDDWHEAFRDTVYPLMKARGLPCGLASISRLSEQSWSNDVTPAEIVTWNRNGVEIHSHGNDHKDPSPHGMTGRGGLLDQIVTSKAEIEAWGVKCQGWMLPGATQLGDIVPYIGNSDPDSYMMHIVRDTYPISEAYAGGASRILPMSRYHCLDHVTGSDGVTLASIKSKVDDAVAKRLGVEFMFHSENIGKPGNISLAEFTEWLDYVVARWNAGELEVLTPSGMYFADRSEHRADFLPDPTFERTVTGSSTGGGYTWSALASGISVVDDGGANVIRVEGTGFAIERLTSFQSLRLGGETFLFEGWCRSTTGSASSRVVLQDYEDLSRLNLSIAGPVTSSTAWRRVRIAFSVAPGTDRVTVGIGRNWGDPIEWREAHVWKV